MPPNTSFTSLNFLAPFFCSISKNFINICAVAAASSTALWWLWSGTPSSFVRLFNLKRFKCGSNILANIRVSTLLFLNSIFISLHFWFINPISNSALWATNTLSPTNSINLGKISSIVGLSFIKSLVIPVNSWTL